MTALDPRSLSALAGVMSVVMGFVLLALRRNYPSSIEGMRHWGLAPLMCAGATLLYALTGPLPGVLSTMGGNTLLVFAFITFYVGTRRFYGLPAQWLPWGLVAAVCLAAVAWFLVVTPDYRWRVSLVTGTMTAVGVAHVALLVRRGRGFAPTFTAALMIVQTVVLALRALATPWVDAADSNRYAPSMIQSIYIATFAFSILLVSLGLLLMAGERVREEFEHLATHDGLTGALTRRAILDAGAREAALWQRYKRPFSVLLMDIDHFKAVNDRFGHLVGDRVLAGVVAAVQQTLRIGDQLGRYGGEEFLVLLPETGPAEARQVAQRICQAVEQYQDGDQPACTTSIGLASAGPGDSSLDTLLMRADAALYRAKALGRNRVEGAADEPAEAGGPAA